MKPVNQKEIYCLIKAVSSVSRELRELRKQQKVETGLLKSMARLATKLDLKQMEKRLTDAMAKNANITPSVETAAILLCSALDQLDATIPDKR